MAAETGVIEGKEAHLGTSLSALPPIKFAKLPPLTVGILAMLGPAFVWASVAQGSGELIWWPYLAAKYGTAFIGILLPACLIQIFVNQEIVRYTALTGEGFWSAVSRIGRWYSVPLFILLFVSYLWFGGYASAGGTAMRDLIGWPTDPRAGSLFWAYFWMFLYVLGLVLSPVIYILIEWFMRVVVVVAIIGAILACLRPEVLAAAGAFFGAYFNPFSGLAAMLNPSSVPGWDPVDTERIVTGIAYAGMGGFWNVLYAYWMRDKNVGMAAHVGRITSPITGEPESIPDVGYAFEDTPENRENWRRWLQYLRTDNILGVVMNTFTVTLMAWLGLAVLHPAGKAPTGWRIAVEQAAFLELVWGPVGRAIFLLVGFVFLADTWIAASDGIARQYGEFFWTNFEWFKRRGYRFWYYVFLAWLAGVTAVTMLLAQPGPLILIAGVISIFAFVLFIPAIAYMNYVKIPEVFPEWVRPSIITMVVLGIVWLIYLLIAIWYLALSPQRLPYFIAMALIWIVVGGYFYMRDRGKS